MIFKILTDGVVKIIKISKNLVAKRSINTCINNLDHSLNPCLITRLNAPCGKDGHVIMVTRSSKSCLFLPHND